MSEINHEYTPEIVCPHCGYTYSESYEYRDDDGELECVNEECEKSFTYVRHVIVEYVTEKKP